MSIKKWQPFSELMNVYDRLNRLFDSDLFADFERERSLAHWSPQTDIYETNESYVIKMELPGFKKDELSVEFNDDTLTVKGERKQDNEVKKENYHRIERYYGTFQRSFTLPRGIDAKKIDANLKDGILTLEIPKAEEAKAKAIPISVK